MEKFQHEFFELDRTDKNRYLEEQNKCPVCFGNLNIYVESIPSTYSLKEEARCVECMTLSRVVNHIIQ